MADCCADKACGLEALRRAQSATLKLVLAINAAMFVAELSAGLLAHSTSLLSDSLDNLGDALTYGLSLLVVARDARAKASVALFKGGLILIAGLFVVGQVAYRSFTPVLPGYETMGLFGVLALTANLTCFGLLWRHRHQDINMRSVWECSRNDIVSNLAVLVAAAGVSLTQSKWPDLAIGLCLALMLLRSAWRVVEGALAALREAAPPMPVNPRYSHFDDAAP